MNQGDAQFSRLKRRHQELEKQIDVELKHAIPDTIRITEMKKEKLRIKERLASTG